MSRTLIWILSSLLTASTALPAQEPTEEERREREREVVHRIIRVEHADVAMLHRALQIFGAPMTHDAVLGVIAVRGPKATVDAVEEAIRRLDVVPDSQRSVELTAYLLIARKDADANEDELPEELSSVEREIEKVLAYRSFELWDTVVLRTVEGGKSVVRVENDQYELSIAEVRLADSEDGPVIRLGGLSVSVANPEHPDEPGVSIRTDVELREGQKVVVGRANMGGTDAALIVVLTGQLVQ